MGFLIGEIIAFLAGAALIGLFIGWALFGGKKAAPVAAGAGASAEALKKAETRIKELEAERDGGASNLVERDDEIARLRHQIAQAEQYRVESAERIEQLKTQAGVLQEQLKERDADLALAGDAGPTPGTGVAVAELTQRLHERELELKKLQVRYDDLASAAGPDAPSVAELKAQINELRATLESGGEIAGGGESEPVSRLMEQNAKLSEENLGLKAAYEAAERSLEEQDGAMDQLSQVLLKSQQESAALKQELASLKAQAGRSSELGITFPPPLPAGRAVAPLAVEDAAEEEDATRAIAAFDLPDDDDDDELPPPPPLPPAPPQPAAALPVPVVEEVEPEEATVAIQVFDLPDEGPPQLPPAAAEDEEEADEATVAMPVFDLDEDTELDASAAPPVEVDGADDLKRIKGIGPATEKRLKAAGIESWSQLAALDDAGIDALAEEIKVSADKIRKEEWAEQARDLQANG
jgi:predicted flap endonuclease-1-like 5' DNA nuclease